MLAPEMRTFVRAMSGSFPSINCVLETQYIIVYLGRNNFPEAPMTSRELLWGPPAGARRGPKPRYTLDAIAEAAMTIADDEGLDAVTMQRVAERLGTTKMALYRYMPGRAELDAVMLDRALGLPPAASPEVGGAA